MQKRSWFEKNWMKRKRDYGAKVDNFSVLTRTWGNRALASLFGWRQGGDVRQFAATPSPPHATVDSPPTPKTADSRLYYLRRLYCPLVSPLVIWRFVSYTLLLPVVKSDAVPNLTSAFYLGRHCSRLRVSIFMTRYKNEKESDLGGTFNCCLFCYKLSYVKRCCVFSI